jgi:histidine kinase/histidine kinase/DNA gyrase B/HSP90-like ATPase
MSLIVTARQFGAGIAAGYRRYAEWLVSITWKRFFLLSLLFLILAGVLSGIPPFSWDIATKTTRKPASRNVDITVDDQGVRIKPRRKGSQAPEITIDEKGIRIKRKADASGNPPREIIIDERGVQMRGGPEVSEPTPPTPPKPPSAQGSIGDDIRREVIEPLRHEIAEAKREAAEDARRDAEAVRRELKQELAPQALAAEIRREVMDAVSQMGDQEHVVHIRLGNYLPQVAFFFILLSAAIKIAYAGRVKAEVKAAEAQEVATEESLKRQVVEARMAAMQAQVEPHFLFHTLASIDRLIETDPSRASKMQKNLIALLRASMPAMREKSTNLGRELDVVRPYLEILRVRMEDRLQPQVNVPEGLYSADFPPMMLQSLVENAVKHGLEPKAEGGAITVSAEVVHGKLAVTVADTGVGFARAATAGTGTGLNNIRERLKLIYGAAAELRIAENAPSGTRVIIVVPYKAT